MRTADVREVFEKIIPDSELLSLVDGAKFQERSRKLSALQFLRAMVIASATEYGGRQAGVMRLYFEFGASKVVRGSFYRWFSPALEQVMKQIADKALDYVRQQPLDLPGLLGKYVRDWHIWDSTIIKLPDILKSEYRDTNEGAAIKVHKRFSVGAGTLIEYRFSEGREHDNKNFRVDESYRGLGLLLDLGYVSFQLLRDCAAHGVHYVIRLKEGWNPKVDFIAQGQLKHTFFKGTDLEILKQVDGLKLNGSPVDMDVRFGKTGDIQCRLVGVCTPAGEYRFYLTSLPREVSCEDIATLYRVRWEIEADNKLDKSCLQMDNLDCQTGHALRAMLHASLTSSIIVCMIAHKHRLSETKPKRGSAERTVPPIHPQTMARMMGAMAQRIARAFDLEGIAAEREWRFITETLEHMGKDPNWRRRPSVLDQLRGWKILPAKSKVEKSEAGPVLCALAA